MRQQYNHPVAIPQVQRTEHWIPRSLFWTLVGLAIVGGLALLFTAGLVGRWTAPRPTPLVARTLQVTAEVPGIEKAMRELTSDLKSLVGKFTPAVRRPSPAPKPAQPEGQPSAQPTAPPAPQQVQLSGSLEVHYGQVPTTAVEPGRARRLTPEELDEATARWLEGRNDP